MCMYGRTSSSGVESMNRANNEICQRTAVDILNAALVLIKKESERFEQNKKNAHKVSVWATPPPLTHKGMILTDEVFGKCDPSILSYSSHSASNVSQLCGVQVICWFL